MKIRYLLPALLLSAQAHANPIPLLSGGKIDTGNWYLSDGWVDGSFISDEWKAGAVAPMASGGVSITLSALKGGLAPYQSGELQSMTTQAYGDYEVNMTVAKGSGLNSAFFTYTATPHDEIDFEFLGKNTKQVSLNYWVNGVSEDGTVIDLGFDASAAAHNYSFQWGPHSISWFVDGRLVHATKVGATMPSHSQRMYLELWSGSSVENGWMGVFTYSAPVHAYYYSVAFTPCNAANSATPWCKP